MRTAGPQRSMSGNPRGRSALATMFLSILMLLISGSVLPQRSPQASPPAVAALDLAPTDRILVLAPHPDDEVVGCGGLLQRAVARGIPVQVVFLTYGDSNAWSFLTYRLHPVVAPSAARAMGEVRRREALAADAVLGVPVDRLTFLGYPDHGTLDLWTSHWGPRPPGHGPLTRARAVPYATAFRPGAPYKGEEVLADLESLLLRFRPTQVFVSHPADRHPDHAALYLFARVALWDLEGKVKATLHPYLVHFPAWPARGYQPSAPAVGPASLESEIAWRSWELTPVEVERKRRALAAHRSQWRSGERHLLPFARATEITGEFPSLALPAGEAPATEEVFIGIERLRRIGDRLEVALTFSRDFPPGTRLSLLAFGYRRDRPFAELPKTEVRVSARSVQVLDQGLPIPAAAARGVTVERSPDRVTLGLPLSLLGSPERLLLSARTLSGRSTVGRLPWREVDLAGPPEPAPGPASGH